jgi:hypothetical protein
VDVGVSVSANSEYYPIVLAPRASGGMWLSWADADSETIYLGALNADDTFQGIVATYPGEEVHAIIGQEDGGALAIIQHDPDIASPEYCSTSPTSS